eukprot:663708_1
MASHGYRWLDYSVISESVEREHIQKTVKVHENLFGCRPVGLYQGKPSRNTKRLAAEEGGFAYLNDSYADDLPYWDLSQSKPQLIVPYTLTNNDMRFCSPNAFITGRQFFEFLKDGLDELIREGKNGAPKMMSVGLHARIIGHPARLSGLRLFLEYVRELSANGTVWVAKREEIASVWKEQFPCDNLKSRG